MKANNARQIKSSINLMMNAINSQDIKSIERYNKDINVAIESEREYQKELTNIAIYLKQSDRLFLSLC